MTVILEGAGPRYIGAAADSKPTGVPVGSRFLEYDTDKVFICYDGTNWVAVDTAASDAGPAWTSVLGVSGAVVSSADMSGAVASITAAPTSGQKLVVTDIVVSTDTAMRVDLKEETTGTIFFSFYAPANGGPMQITPRGKFKLATADKKLQAQTSAAGNVRITTLYYSEA